MSLAADTFRFAGWPRRTFAVQDRKHLNAKIAEIRSSSVQWLKEVNLRPHHVCTRANQTVVVVGRGQELKLAATKNDCT